MKKDKEIKKNEVLPVLTNLVLLNNRTLYYADGRQQKITDIQSKIMQDVMTGGNSLDELCEKYRMCIEDIRSFLDDTQVIDFINSNYDNEYDMVVFADMHTGGCSVFASDLWEKMNKNYNVLMVSLHEPIYNSNKNLSNKLISLKSIINKDFTSQNFNISFVNFTRTILKRTKIKLFFFSNRPDTIYYSDIINLKRTIIHTDGCNERLYVVSKGLNSKKYSFEDIKEMYFSLYLYAQNIFPIASVSQLKLGWDVMRNTAENWFYSNEYAQKIRNTYTKLKNIEFVSPFIDTDRFVYSTSKNKKYVLFTTNMTDLEKKGYDVLIKTFKYLPSNIQFLFLIRYNNNFKLKDKPLNLKILSSDLLRDEMKSEIYDRTLIYCRPSKMDSVPYSLLEAMACGIPVIVSPMIAKTLPILEDGVTGFTVDPYNPKEIAAKIKYLIVNKDIRKAMGKECCRRVQQYSFKNNKYRFDKYLLKK